MSKVDYNREIEYGFSYKTVFNALIEAVRDMSGINLSSANEGSGSFVLETEARLLSLGEKISIHLKKLAPNRTKLEVLSSLGVSESFEREEDFGINRKNVLKVVDHVSKVLSEHHGARDHK